MEEQKTLLQQIVAKEAQLNLELQQAVKEAEAIVSGARIEAGKTIQAAEIEGNESAQKYLKAEKEKTEMEVERIKALGAVEVSAIREKAEKNLPAAVEVIARNVAFE